MQGQAQKTGLQVLQHQPEYDIAKLLLAEPDQPSLQPHRLHLPASAANIDVFERFKFENETRHSRREGDRLYLDHVSKFAEVDLHP